MLWVLIKLMVTLSAAQHIEIRDLSRNKGILPINLGAARLITSHNNLIHIVNLDKYMENIDNINNTLKLFEQNKSTKTFTSTTKLKLQELRSKLNNLVVKRHKRGLVDGLGHAIKFITGNMDAKDAQEINQQIRQLESNFQTTISQNHQLNLNMAMRFENITNHINEVQETIESFLNGQTNEIAKYVENAETTIREIQYLNQINYNIDILTNHINDISEAIILAKLNIIPRLILHPDEIRQISQHLESQLIETKSVENIYELLSLQAYYNETNIIFNIKIPNLDPNLYQYYHIIPLPLNKTKIISTEPYLLYNDLKIIYTIAKCPRIENVHYCKDFKNIEITANSSCIGRLMQNQNASCVVNDIGDSQSIYQPEPNLILFINAPKTQINTTCKFGNQMIEGTALVRYKNCKVRVNNITYSDDTNTFWEDIYIVPPPIAEVQATTEIKTLTLKKLADYDMRQEDKILTISSRINVHDLVESVLGLIIIGAIIFTLKEVYVQKTKQSIQAEAAVPSIPQLQTKGGGVTYTLPYMLPTNGSSMEVNALDVNL